MTSVEKNITEKLSNAESGEETTIKLKRSRDYIVDVNEGNRTPFNLLDGQILCEILVRLPVKSLLQVKRVCKHWRSVVRDPYFIGLHFTRSKACPKLLIFVCKGIAKLLFSVDLLEGGMLLDQMKLEIQSEHDPVEILNPINGLVCFKKWKNNYKSNTARYETGVNDVCEVLTVGQNSWRKIDDFPPYKVYGQSVYVNGVIYWLSTYNYFDSSRSADVKSVIAFDVGREKFRVILIPDFIVECRQSSRSNRKNWHDLLVIDGCLGLLDRKLIVDGDGKDAIRMWIFHDDQRVKSNTSSSWTEETISIPLEWPHKWVENYQESPRSELLFQAITGTDLIIMKPKLYEQSGGVFSLYCYDRKKKTLNFVEISTVSNGKGFLMHEPVYQYACGTLVESLYPVQ